jgi:NAD-specific glutamate dehydrogenase
MWLYQSAIHGGGVFLDIEPTVDELGKEESRLIFSIINPLREGYIAQLIEVFYRLNIATRRNYILEIDDGQHRVTILTAYITTRAGEAIRKDMPIFSSLEWELYNTRVIDIQDRTYRELVTDKVLTGPEGSLLTAMNAFVHTNLAHSSPYRYNWDETQDAFFSHLQLTRELLQLFQGKFNPDPEKRMGEEKLETEYQRIESLIEDYNTGHALLENQKDHVSGSPVSCPLYA